MINDKKIEELYAKKYNTTTTTRKDIGDIYVEEIPWNIKSNNLDKVNYSPNLISADKLFDHLNSGKMLKFLFVDYRGDSIITETLVDAIHISWDCLTIQCQGKGVIQVSSDLKVDESQTKEDFLKGFTPAYRTYFKKERSKIDKLELKYCGV
jgi:hypothetical protein|tara:strand:- start:69 stop:524 length:456 start_codon:yes stop_codon:yes gene_type:complete